MISPNPIITIINHGVTAHIPPHEEQSAVPNMITAIHDSFHFASGFICNQTVPIRNSRQILAGSRLLTPNLGVPSHRQNEVNILHLHHLFLYYQDN